LNSSGSSFSQTFRDINDDPTWSYGVNANWQLIAGTSRIASLKSANSAVRDAELQLLLTKQNIEVSVRDAYRNLEESSARIKLAEARLADATLNSTLFRENYKLGNCTLLELLQAEQSLREAESELVGAKFDYRMAVAELARWNITEE
jgi:outer membrane protein TolC